MTDPDAQRLRETVMDRLAADPESYLSLYSSRFGNVLNADDAATLFDGYNADRARFRVAVHPAATWIRDELFRRALAAPAEEGKGHIAFTAGCNAAGKSTVIGLTQARLWAHAILDSTFSNPVHARGLVEATLAADKRITILHIDRPPDDALFGMLERSTREGRVVSIHQVLHSHQGAAETVRALWTEFRDDPRFAFRFLENSSNGTQEASIEITAPRDYTEVRAILREILDTEYRAGRITQATYDRVRG